MRRFILISMLFLGTVMAEAVLDVGYRTDNQVLSLQGPSASLSTNTVYIGYKGNTNRVDVSGGASLQIDDKIYIGWTSYDGYFGDGIPAHRNAVNVSGSDSSIQSKTIHVGLGPSTVGSSLQITQGGSVSADSVFAGFYAGHANQIVVEGADSTLNVSGTNPESSLVIGSRSGGNSMVVADGGVVQSGSAIIGFSDSVYLGTNNIVIVTGENSRWDTGNKLIIGSGALSERSQLHVLDGGEVVSSQVRFGSSGASDNEALVSGEDSRWVINQNLYMGGFDAAAPNRIDVESGGALVVKGYLLMNNSIDTLHTNTLEVRNGGTLELEKGFDASTEGFVFGVGGTLKVAGNLSNLAELKSGRTLVATNVFGNLLINGTFFMQDQTTVHGDLTLGSDGMLEFVLSETEQTMLSITGTAKLSGTLSILFDDDVTYAHGTQIQLFDFQNGYSGNFSDITAAPLNDGLYLDTTLLNSTGSMSVIPEPATAGLMGLSALFFYMMRVNRSQIGTWRCILRFRRSSSRVPVSESW